MTTTTTTKATKVIAALENGTELTAKQISARYGVKNVRALMSSLRMQGYPVYLNKRASAFEGQTKVYISIVLVRQHVLWLLLDIVHLHRESKYSITGH